ncbi:MAG: metalloregulator ArsR/SmtB family transcription factor [Desulfobacteraceae bacterium]|nr:metalloregulator ArsR/SmtB family transcription factor [Desulfobacteraceae bacterium]
MDDTLLKLKALADRNRLRIFLALTRYDELCACQITELLQVTGATASRHLGILVTAGLLKSRKESRWVYFSLDDRGMDMDGISGWLLPRVQTSDRILTDLAVLERIMAVDKEDLCRMQRGEACCPVKNKEKTHG